MNSIEFILQKFTMSRIWISLPLVLPKDLKQELVQYCLDYAYVLGKTKLFPVSERAMIDSCLSLVNLAVEHGHVNLLKWALSRRLNVSGTKTCALASRKGHLEILKWLRLNYYPWDKCCFMEATVESHFHILEWLRKNGCPWNEEVCSVAASYGNLPVLQWLRKHKCPWDEGTCNWAAMHGHLHVLQWSIENKCPFNRLICSYNATIGNHVHISNWLRDAFTKIGI